MSILSIFNEISSEPGTNNKMAILSKYKDNELLKEVLYLANSKRIKFYIKQIPEYKTDNNHTYSLEESIKKLEVLYKREKTGHDAINFLSDLLSSVSKEDAVVLERIIDKDCKIGMGTSNINKVFKNLIEDTPYMGARAFDEKLAKEVFKNGEIAFSQIKMDGRYCNAIIRHNHVELESRQGEPTILIGAKFLNELENFDNCVLNGELTIDKVSRYESNGIIASLIDICGKKEQRSEEENKKKTSEFEKKHGNINDALNSIRFTVWDTITIDEYFNKSSKTPYIKRLENVNELIKKSNSTMVSIIETKQCNNYGEAISHFQDMLSKGYEGTILKSSIGNWKDSKPNWQIKMKLEMDVDMRIVGFNYGTGKNEKLISSLNVESSDGKVITRPTGIDEDMMKFITENQEKLLNSIVEVKCSGLSKNSNGQHALLHPVFKKLRDDKNSCDSLESIQEIEDMAKGLIKL